MKYLEKNLFQCHFVHQKAYTLLLLLLLPLFLLFLLPPLHLLLLLLPLIILTLPFFFKFWFFFYHSFFLIFFNSFLLLLHPFSSSSYYYYMEPQVRTTQYLSTRLKGIFGLGIGPLHGPSLQITTQTQNKRRHTFIPRAGF